MPRAMLDPENPQPVLICGRTRWFSDEVTDQLARGAPTFRFHGAAVASRLLYKGLKSTDIADIPDSTNRP
jgi:hypothetical protein